MSTPPNSPPPGSPPPPPSGSQREPDAFDRFLEQLRGLGIRRSPDGWIGGVSGGIAARLGIDPLVVRAAFVLFGLVFGAGLTLYLIAWVLLPDQEGQIKLERAIRGGDVGSVGLLIVAVLVSTSGFGWLWGWNGPAPLVAGLLIAGVLWFFFSQRGQQSSSRSGGTAPSGATRFPSGEPPAGAAASSAAPPTTGTGPTWTSPVARDLDPQTSTATWPATGTAASAVAAPPAPAPQTPLAPVRPIRRRLGAGGTLIVFGLALLAAAGTLLILSGGHLDDVAGRLALVAGTGVVGLGALVSGLTGRRAGLLGFTGLLLACATTVAAVIPHDVSLTGDYGDVTWRPNATTLTTQERDLSGGSALLNLSDVAAPTTPVTTTAHVSMGELRIRVPRDLPVTIHADVGLGVIDADSQVSAETQFSSTNGANRSRTVQLGAGSPRLTIEARVGLGSIVIERTS
ncbi:PspC domain-containing protein [Dermacoccaceae bacterium W4C1]